MSDTPTIPDGDLGFDVISYAREILTDTKHHDADEFSACARETLAAMLAAWDRLRERHDTLFRNHAFLMATKIPPTVVSIPAPPTPEANGTVRKAEERLRRELAAEAICECGPTYCPHVVLSMDAARDLLAALASAATEAERLPLRVDRFGTCLMCGRNFRPEYGERR